MAPCILCSIVSGDADAFRIYEDERTLAVLDRAPATEGHALVIPKAHVEDIWGIEEQDAAAVMATACRVAKLLEASHQPLGLNLVQSNGRAAWQEVFHFHLHVVPRYDGDGLVRPWRSTHPSGARLSEVRRQLVGS